MTYKRQLVQYRPIQITPWSDGVFLVYGDGSSFPVVALGIFEETTQYLEGVDGGKEWKYKDDSIDVFVDAVCVMYDGEFAPVREVAHGQWQLQKEGRAFYLPVQCKEGFEGAR